MYIPAADAQESARGLLASFVPDADEVIIEVNDQIGFHSGSANYSGASCPVCGKDVQPWFFDTLDERYHDGFNDFEVITPCCGAAISLNDLNFVWPAGFSRFALDAMNPNVYDLSLAQIEELEGIIGCKLRRIWTHI
jgi:hypothetical protein